jgi:hypothetical protein
VSRFSKNITRAFVSGLDTHADWHICDILCITLCRTAALVFLSNQMQGILDSDWYQSWGDRVFSSVRECWLTVMSNGGSEQVLGVVRHKIILVLDECVAIDQSESGTDNIHFTGCTPIWSKVLYGSNDCQDCSNHRREKEDGRESNSGMKLFGYHISYNRS